MPKKFGKVVTKVDEKWSEWELDILKKYLVNDYIELLKLIDPSPDKLSFAMEIMKNKMLIQKFQLEIAKDDEPDEAFQI